MTPNGKKHIALYPGTFDGLTYGHLDIIKRAARLVDRLCVAVAHNEDKTPLLTPEERMEILRAETAGLHNVEVAAFHGLTMEYARGIGAHYIIRSIRAVSDFEYELQMALMNRALETDVETVFMVPAAEYLYLSSSIIKEIMLLGGDVSQFVPPSTERLMRERLQRPGTADQPVR